MNSYTTGAFFFILTSAFTVCTGDYMYVESHEDRLRNALMKNYLKDSRPVRNSSQTTQVDISISYPRIESLEESMNTMTVTMMVFMAWNDDRFVWNASEYGGLASISVHEDNIWIPELEPYDVLPTYQSHRQSKKAIVTASGLVSHVPIMTIPFFCSFDLSNFPYDTQTCSLNFGTWTYSSQQTNITYMQKLNELMHIDLKNDVSLNSHPHWVIKNMAAYAGFKKYECCPETYPTLQINITTSRIASYYRLVLVGPSVFLALLTPLTFLLPGDPTLRSNYGMLLLLCMTLMILIFQEAIPFDHASVPVLAVFYFGILVVQVFSIIFSTIVSNVFNNGKRRKPLPAWLTSLCLNSRFLHRILCLNATFSWTSDVETTMNMRLLEEAHDYPQDTGLENVDIASSENSRDVANNTKILAGKVLRDATYEKIKHEWQHVAKVMDRIFFILFVFVDLLVALSTFL